MILSHLEVVCVWIWRLETRTQIHLLEQALGEENLGHQSTSSPCVYTRMRIEDKPDYFLLFSDGFSGPKHTSTHLQVDVVRAAIPGVGNMSTIHYLSKYIAQIIPRYLRVVVQI